MATQGHVASAAMAKVAIFAKLVAHPGKRDEAAVALEQMFEQVEQEDGTEQYVLHEDLGDENVLWFYELYTHGDAAAEHGASDAMKATFTALGDLVADTEIVMAEPTRAKGVDL